MRGIQECWKGGFGSKSIKGRSEFDAHLEGRLGAESEDIGMGHGGQGGQGDSSEKRGHVSRKSNSETFLGGRNWIFLLSFILLLVAQASQAAFYPYQFRNGQIVVIGTGKADREGLRENQNPMENQAWVERNAKSGITYSTFLLGDVSRISGGEALPVAGVAGPKTFYVAHVGDVSDIIIFGGRNRLNVGRPVGVPVMDLNQTNELQSNAEALVLVQRRREEIEFKIITSSGLHFDVKYELSGTADLSQQVHLENLFSRIRLYGGFVEGDRAFLAMSLESKFGNRTYLVSTKLADSDTAWDKHDIRTRYRSHQMLKTFVDRLYISKKASPFKHHMMFSVHSRDVQVLSSNSWTEIRLAPDWITGPQKEGGMKTSLPLQNQQTNLLELSTMNESDLAANTQSEFPLPSEYRMGSESLEQNGRVIHFIERVSDSKRVIISVDKYLQKSRVTVDSRGVVSVEGVLRQVSLPDFDMEATYSVSLDSNVKTTEGLVKEAKPEEIVEQFFPRWIPDGDRDAYGFSADDRETIQNVREQMMQKKVKSVVLLGDPGSGKSVLLGEVFRSLPPTWSVHVFDRANLESGTGLRGAMETRIQSLLMVAKQKPLVLFVDELHSMRGAGAPSFDGPDIFELFKPALASGELILLGTDTREEFQDAFGVDDAIKRRISSIEMPIPKGKDLIAKLETQAQALGLKELDAAFLNRIVSASAKILPQYNEPFRSSLVLEQFAKIKEKEDADLSKADVRLALLAKAIKNKTSLFFDLGELRQYLSTARKNYSKAIAGDDAVKEKLFAQAEIGFAGLYSGIGPMVRILLTGPAGVGKSERGIAYAKAMNLPFLKIQQSTLGFHPDEMITKVANALEKNPFTVLIIDELEKFPAPFREMFLDLLGSNSMTVQMRGQNARRVIRNVYTRFATVIATSNAGEEYLTNVMGVANGSRTKRSIGFLEPSSNEGNAQTSTNGLSMSDVEYQQILKRELGEYLVDRFPFSRTIVRIPNPDRATLRKIMLLKAANKIKQLKEGDFLGVSPEVRGLAEIVDEVVEVSVERSYGVRNATDLLESKIDDLVREVMERNYNSGLQSASRMRCEAIFQ